MANKKEKNNHYFRTFLVFVILFICLVVIYARYIGTTGLRVREYVIENPKLSANFNGLKIVHFSDLHFGTTVFISGLEKIVKEINFLKPDIIVFTGDLIDKNYNIKDSELEELINTLNKLEPNISSYMIKGNHDISKAYNELTEKVDFKLLVNDSELFYYNDNIPLLIIGLDDLLVGKPDIAVALENIPEEEYYRVLLAHEPDIIKDLADYNIDLFLSGHSHNGQVRLPFFGAIIKNHGALTYYDPYYSINNTDIYISGGLGTRALPFRLFNKPSFNFYRFFAE